MRIYLDSNVIISLLKEELGRRFRLLYLESESFLRQANKSKFTLVLSNLFFEEVTNILKVDKKSIMDYLSGFSLSIEEFYPKNNPRIKLFHDLGINYPDSLHLALALESNCDCIVTFNKKDFDLAGHIIAIREPTDFL